MYVNTVLKCVIGVVDWLNNIKWTKGKLIKYPLPLMDLNCSFRVIVFIYILKNK